jgi:hypothetical protein
VKLEFEAGREAAAPSRPTPARIVFVGDGGLPADVPGGAVVHVLQWTETGKSPFEEIEERIDRLRADEWQGLTNSAAGCHTGRLSRLEFGGSSVHRRDLVWRRG